MVPWRPSFCYEDIDEMHRVFALLIAAFLLAPASAVRAEHEVNHRYTVQGYVLDGERRRLEGVGVSVKLGGQLLGSAVTNGDGFYRMRLHLHDSQIGSELAVRTADAAGSIRMRAKYRDNTTIRRHYANFVGGELVEGELPGMGIDSGTYVAAAGITAVVVVGFTVAGLRRRARRLRRAQEIRDRKPRPRSRAKRKGRRRR